LLSFAKSVAERLDANSGICRLRGETEALAAGNDIHLPPTFQIHKKLASTKLMLEGGQRAESGKALPLENALNQPTPVETMVCF
jgi:hypothetical protein